MWTVIAAFFGAVLSFAGAMVGVWIKGKDLKDQLHQAHSNLVLQLHRESSNLEQTINAQASDLRQRLTFEGERDKRTIYAAALAALKKFEIAATDDSETTARVAVAGVLLVAPPDVCKAAESTLEVFCGRPETSADRASRVRDSWNQMVHAMREDLGVNDPFQPPTPNSPTLDGDDRAEPLAGSKRG